MEEMIPALLKGGFYHAGQVCVSVQKIYAHKLVVEELANKLSRMAEQLVVGDPLDKKTEVGPLIETSEVDRVQEWVNQALEEGARLICGGNRISDTCFEPTILLDPPETSKVSRNEIFGPVVCIYSYTDRLKAIELANSLPFCFQAAVFSKNLDIALDTASRLKATSVMINDHTAFRVDWMPFGGLEESGIGVGGIPYTMHEMSREKLTVIKSSLLP
jgi:acyl-CoA reductase-like NAD-dependent aldehyde dehydrogenase